MGRQKRSASSSDKGNNNSGIVIVAIIGLLGTLATAFFSFLSSTKPLEISIYTTQTAEAKLGLLAPASALPTLTSLASQIVVNTSYLAALVGKEQFTEQLPEPFTFSGFGDVQINDVSAAQRLNAVEVKLSIDPKSAQVLDPQHMFSDLHTFAHIEVYKSKEDALKRFQASRALLMAQYPDGVGSELILNETFCIAGYPDFWTCAGSRGFAYAEVTLSPGSNANLGLANGILSAMLKYTDKMTTLATNQ